jgi:ribosomal protein S27E
MKIKTEHLHPKKLIQLEWPPPAKCINCRRSKIVYATLEGWRCQNCLPDSDKVDEYGIKYKKPRVNKKEEAYFNHLREIFQNKMTTKNCKVCGKEIVSTGRGRPRLVHESCKPFKKQDFVLSENARMPQELAKSSEHTPGIGKSPERL